MDYRILGPLEVRREDRAVELGGRKQRALLALLLLHANELVPADRLIEELWAGSPPVSAAKSLQVYVSRLRKQLGGQAVRTLSGGYLLEVGESELDLDRFRASLERGRRLLAAGEAAAAADELRHALALWQGPPLVDFRYDSFAQAEIARLEELRLAAEEERIEAELARGRHAELLPELEALVERNSLRERLRGQLMLALYRSGRQAEALETYAAGRRALAEELGIEPGDALQELERRILRRDASLGPSGRGHAGTGDVAGGRLAAGAFVGRERELSELEAALGDAVAGRGRLVLLAGEAGIGKSRLADELAARAKAQGVRVLWGRCWEAGGAPAYWPWVQALRAHVREVEPEALRGQLGRGAADLVHLLPELRDLLADVPEPSSLESEGARFRLFESTAAFLRAAARATPLVVVLDDLHAADLPSLLMLSFVAAELRETRILIVAAYRDVELRPGDATARALTDLLRQASARLSLRGLSEREVATFVETTVAVAPAAELVTAIAAETEGNPLFVGEIVRLLATEGKIGEPAEGPVAPALPPTVKEVIGRRLEGVSDESLELLALASVLGREFRIATLERLTGVSSPRLLELLDEAVAARVVADVPDQPGRLRFSHALVRDVLYERLPPGRRVGLHARAAEALEDIYGPDDVGHLSELAHHYVLAAPAGHAERAIEYARRAADQALAVLAHEEAARLYGTALRALESKSRHDDRLERELRLAEGEALSRAGDMPRAKEAFVRAAALARATGSAEHLAAAAIGYGGRIVFARAGDDRILVPLLEEALEAVGAGDSELRVRLLARLAGALRDEPSPRRRTELAEEGVEIARRLGDDVVLAYALDGLLGAIIAPDTIGRCQELADELVAVAARAGSVEREIQGHMYALHSFMVVGDVAAVRERRHLVHRLTEDLRQPSQTWEAHALDAILALYDGRYSAAEQLIERALAAGRRAQRLEAEAAYAMQLHGLRSEQGRVAEIEGLLEEAARTYRRRPVFRCALAHAKLLLGRDDEVRRHFEELARDDFAGVPFDQEWLRALVYLAEVAVGLGDRTRAAALLARLEPYAEHAAADAMESYHGSVSRYLGLLADCVGLPDDAAAFFERALEDNGRRATPPWRAHTSRDYGRLLVRTGHGERGRRLLEEARALALELGMSALAAAAGHDLAAARHGVAGE